MRMSGSTTNLYEQDNFRIDDFGDVRRVIDHESEKDYMRNMAFISTLLDTERGEMPSDEIELSLPSSLSPTPQSPSPVPQRTSPTSRSPSPSSMGSSPVTHSLDNLKPINRDGIVIKSRSKINAYETTSQSVNSPSSKYLEKPKPFKHVGIDDMAGKKVAISVNETTHPHKSLSLKSLEKTKRIQYDELEDVTDSKSEIDICEKAYPPRSFYSKSLKNKNFIQKNGLRGMAENENTMNEHETPESEISNPPNPMSNDLLFAIMEPSYRDIVSRQFEAETDGHSSLSNNTSTGPESLDVTTNNVVVPASNVLLANESMFLSSDTDNDSDCIQLEQPKPASAGCLVSADSDLKYVVCDSVPWLTYGRLVSIALLMIILVTVLSVLKMKIKSSDTSRLSPPLRDTSLPSPSPIVHIPLQIPTVTSSMRSVRPSGSATPTLGFRWRRVGHDLNGFASYENSGNSVAISDDGSRISVGGDGVLRIYHLANGNSWSLMEDLSAYISTTISATSLSMSLDGSAIVAGEPNHNRKRGKASVFWEDKEEKWVQLGNSIFGKEVDQGLGYSVAINDNSVVVIGTKSANVVIVLERSSGQIETWNYVHEFVGNDSSYFGQSLSMTSDGSRLFVGAFDNLNQQSGSVYVYDLIDEFKTLVQRIDGEDMYENFGTLVAVSGDGSCFAALSPNGAEYDSVKLFRFDSVRNIYRSVGSVFDFRQSVAVSSLSVDGNCTRVAIGIPFGQGQFANRGKVSVAAIAKNDEAITSWETIGELIGEAVEDNYGCSVALSDNGGRIVVGARGNNGGGYDSGHVRVFEFSGGK